MNGNEHIATEDLAMFVLLLLDEKEAKIVRGHLSECAPCREELQRVGEDLATYALAVEPLPIPQGSRERFLSRLDEDRAQTGAAVLPGEIAGAGIDAGTATKSTEPGSTEPRSAGAPPAGMPVSAPVPIAFPKDALRNAGVAGAPVQTSRSSKAKWIAWAGWAAAAAAIVVAAGLKQDRDALASALGTEIEQAARLQTQADSARHILGTLSDPSAVRVNLTVPKAVSTPSARATYEQKSGTLLLIASNLAPLQAQKVYELWLIPADGSKPVAAGTFSPDAHGNASLLIPTLKGAVAAKAFGITVEQAGGSVTPTMPILLAGTPA